MLLAALKQADWLDEARVKGYAAILLGLATLFTVIWIVLADGLIDRNGQPLGTDFSNIYAAGTLAREGAPADAFSPRPHYAAQQATFGRDDVPFYGWHYPPMFLLVAAALAALPYATALAVWLATTLALYLRAMAPLVAGFGTTGWLLALAFPAVFVNIGHGQNGFLTTALLGGGLLALRSHPVFAGILFGLLTFKPQFGVLLPLVLIATLNWRAFFAAAVTALALAGLSGIAFGAESWQAFFGYAGFTREYVLESGATGWHKFQTLFGALRNWGAPLGLAYGAQAALALGVAGLVTGIWRGAVRFELKAASLVAGTLLVTPYFLDYDLMMLALPIAWLAREALRTGFRPWEKSILAASFVLPLVSRPIAEVTTVPLGVIVPLALFWAIVARTGLYRAPRPAAREATS